MAAVVALDGTLFIGGCGDLLALPGGAFLLTALQTLLAGAVLPYAVRAIPYDLVALGAVMTQRDRQQ
jgi:ribose transport system permease protein